VSVIAKLDLVIVDERLGLHETAINARAIPTADVNQLEMTVLFDDLRVLARNGRVIRDVNIILR
jgi:hypothetical protein